MFNAAEDCLNISAKGADTHSSSNSFRFVLNRMLQYFDRKTQGVFDLLNREVWIGQERTFQSAVVLNRV